MTLEVVKILMKNRLKKKRLYLRFWSRYKLPRQFVKDTLRAIAEANAGKLAPYKWGIQGYRRRASKGSSDGTLRHLKGNTKYSDSDSLHDTLAKKETANGDL